MPRRSGFWGGCIYECIKGGVLEDIIKLSCRVLEWYWGRSPSPFLLLPASQPCPATSGCNVSSEYRFCSFLPPSLFFLPLSLSLLDSLLPSFLSSRSLFTIFFTFVIMVNVYRYRIRYVSLLLAIKKKFIYIQRKLFFIIYIFKYLGCKNFRFIYRKNV